MRNHMVASILAIVIMVLVSAAGCSVEVGSTPTGQSKIQVGDSATPKASSNIKVVSGGDYDHLEENITVIHDDHNGVTCWMYFHGNGTAMSCISDSQLKDQRR